MSEHGTSAASTCSLQVVDKCDWERARGKPFASGKQGANRDEGLQLQTVKQR